MFMYTRMCAFILNEKEEKKNEFRDETGEKANYGNWLLSANLNEFVVFWDCPMVLLLASSWSEFAPGMVVYCNLI